MTLSNDERFGQIRALAEQMIGEQPVPGAVVGVLADGRAAAAGFGVTSVDNPLPVTAETLFQAGSITKTVTAAALLRLVDEGALGLDTPLRALIPNFRMSDPVVTEHLALRHLLTHTGGWEGDYFDDYGWGDTALAKMAEAVSHLPQRTPLGKMFSYNNSGFFLAGRLIEVLTGMPYELAARALVLDPLEMRQSYFFPWEVMTYRYAAGHITQAGRPVVARPWPVARASAPAGGLITCADDLLRYARLYTGGGAPDGARLLSPHLFHEMVSPQVEASGGGAMGFA